MIYIPKHFSLYELLPPEVFHIYKERGWNFFDLNVLFTLDALRERYGSITINDWYWGGNFIYSGFRPWDCPIGAAVSQHKFGRAMDAKFKDVTADEVREDMRVAGCFDPTSQKPFPYAFGKIRRVENFEGMSWFHFDTAPFMTGAGIGVIGDSLTIH